MWANLRLTSLSAPRRCMSSEMAKTHRVARVASAAAPQSPPGIAMTGIA